MTNKIQFDDAAHSKLTTMLDATEAWLVRHDGCEPQHANNRLCRDYIMRCSDMVYGAVAFLSNDERIGTQHFIADLRGPNKKARSVKTIRTCAAQLLKFPHLYFKNYPIVLRTMFLSELPKLPTRDLVSMSGVVMLAAANLPGVRSDVRRELRRRGDERDSLIVPDDTLERQLERFKPGLFAIID